MSGRCRSATLSVALGLGCAFATAAQQPVVAVPGASPGLVEDSIDRYIRNASVPDSLGTGPYPSTKLEEPTLPEHVVYRPADLSKLGDTKMPLYVFGNGACSEDGASQRHHLLEIASFGYLAIAAGKIYSGPDVPVTAEDWARHRDRTSFKLLGDAIDWAAKENARPGSPYFDRIDVNRVAVSGYSCGGAQALRYAGDPRISTFVILNAGLSDADTPRTGEMDVDPALLDRIEVPVLYVLGGPGDVAYNNGMADYRRLTDVPVAAINMDVGHQGTFADPNGGKVARAVVAWLQWQLRADPDAGNWFVGEGCSLCRDPNWTIERRNLADDREAAE